ncbi:MAG TPA: stage III sporulation protein SpoIIIAB [Clostridia bacterium]|nr:stage III sporulation protein SpoIIIAB [Clostridia bacterium]
MLLKIVGSLVVILSCSFLGLILSRDCSRRPQQLRELQTLLQMFENQISYLSDVLIEAFERVNRVANSETGLIFGRAAEILGKGEAQSAANAWEQAVRQCIRRTALNREDEEVLVEFGKLLGSTDLEGQIKNIRLTMEALRIQEKKAEESRSKNETMYKSLGILGGIAVVIVLL